MVVKEPSIGDFFSVLAFRPQANAVYEHKKRGFTKIVPRVNFFSKLQAYRFRVSGQKRRFSNTMMSYIIQPITIYPVRDAIVYPLFESFCGRNKAILIRYV